MRWWWGSWPCHLLYPTCSRADGLYTTYYPQITNSNPIQICTRKLLSSPDLVLSSKFKHYSSVITSCAFVTVQSTFHTLFLELRTVHVHYNERSISPSLSFCRQFDPSREETNMHRLNIIVGYLDWEWICMVKWMATLIVYVHVLLAWTVTYLMLLVCVLRGLHKAHNIHTHNIIFDE